MTVSSSTNKVSFNGDDSTTVFAYSFKVFDQDDLTVIIRSSNGTETTKTITTDYTVSGVGNAGGGNVTMVTAPATGETLTILREQDLLQGLDLVPNDPFPAQSLEDSLDKLVFMVQQHDEELARAIKASKTNTIGSTEFTVSASDRASKVFAFDSSGELAVTQELGTFRGNWAASTAFAERDLVKDSSNSNIYICLTAHTSSGTTPISSNADSAKWGLIVDAAAAATSASNAATSESNAATSEANAATSASAAATSESNASTSATTASTQATAAAGSATAAAASATAAAGSESAAATSESNASTSETNAATSATNAATSATNAATSESNASTSESNASTSATTATTQATNAATSATNAATSESNAATSESNASTSETNAANSATAAAASQTAAANSAAAAASAFDNFDDTYLGSKTSDPTVDNDGDPLTSGDLYFNSTANEMRVYDGANWIAATSAGNVSLLNYSYTATSGQTTFSGADDNAASLSYTVQNLIVTLNGIVLEDGTDYTATSGTSIVLSSGAATGDELNIVAFKSFTTADMVPASTGGTFSGNVSMTADLTVDTNTLYVDSANNRVGVGTSSPSSKLEVIEGDTDAVSIKTDGHVQLYDSTSSSRAYTFLSRNTANSMVGGNIRLDTSVTAGSHVGYSNGTDVRGGSGILFENTSGGAAAYGETIFVQSNDTNDDTWVVRETMRIDASGNLLVGKTATSSVDAGVVMYPDGLTLITRDDQTPLSIRRNTSDGDLLQFRKDGTTVGSIEIQSHGFEINGESGHSGISFASASWVPKQNGSRIDNTIDLGVSSYRFDDVRATNGTIQTSDRNDKQDIAALTATEMLVAARISAMFKTFRWIDRVTDNPNARTHTGIIAQDVQQAFTDEGLDAGNYALFISDTWWETQTDVPAVAAVAEVLDDDGNVVTEAVEAQDAYTRTDTYDTQADAPAGATERTRLGIRYPELLSFIAAYNEQRFTDIEARLTALEAN